MPYTLVLGGARAGKSGHAQHLAEESGRAVTVIATAWAGDEEMAARIGRHRATRPSAWTTVEAPHELLEAVRTRPPSEFLLVDCLTLWVSNLLGKGRSPDEVLSLAACVVDELAGRHAAVVSNEVGLGIVPANELARTFRDLLGAVNARFAAGAARTVLMVAGRSLELT